MVLLTFTFSLCYLVHQTESDSEYESNTEEELDEVQDTNTAGGASRNLLGRSDSGDVNDLRKVLFSQLKRSVLC